MQVNSDSASAIVRAGGAVALWTLAGCAVLMVLLMQDPVHTQQWVAATLMGAVCTSFVVDRYCGWANARAARVSGLRAEASGRREGGMRRAA